MGLVDVMLVFFEGVEVLFVMVEPGLALIVEGFKFLFEVLREWLLCLLLLLLLQEWER